MRDFSICYGVADTNAKLLSRHLKFSTSNGKLLTYDNEKNDVLVNVLYTDFANFIEPYVHFCSLNLTGGSRFGRAVDTVNGPPFTMKED